MTTECIVKWNQAKFNFIIWHETYNPVLEGLAQNLVDLMIFFHGPEDGLRDLSGAGANWSMVEIWWHRQETRRKTEKTNLNL